MVHIQVKQEDWVLDIEIKPTKKKQLLKKKQSYWLLLMGGSLLISFSVFGHIRSGWVARNKIKGYEDVIKTSKKVIRRIYIRPLTSEEMKKFRGKVNISVDGKIEVIQSPY